MSYTRVPGIEAIPAASRSDAYRSGMRVSRTNVLPLALVASACVALPAQASAPAPKPGILCTLAPGQTSLAPGARHGLAAHLLQYPDLALATPAQKAAAVDLLARARAASVRWRDVKVARAHGFDTHLAKRAPGDTAVGYLHAEHRRFSADRRYLDPKRPESLIYATEPGRKPVLVGIMFSVPRGVRGPTPAGPIARWHSHVVCMRGHERGLAPAAGGGCPKGTRMTQGSEMLHLWFTSDLRSAFAVHAPVPELCRDGLLSPTACRSGASRGGM